MSRAVNEIPDPFPTESTESETSGTGHVGDAATVPPTSEQPAPGSSEQTPLVQGLHTPEIDEADTRT
ncbi:MAG: hypothetical protein JWL79_2215 [Frankiales bacterium]|jgi:hypothetical protein|nr:hypothetical protein [Frankiales bacterium]